MLSITEAAGAHLTKLLTEAQAPDSMAIRLKPASESGTSLDATLDEERSGDSKILHEGRAVLYFGPKVAEAVDSRILDLEETDSGPQLSLR